MAEAAPPWLAVGRVSKPHGIHGELLVDVVTDFPDRLQPGVNVGLGPDTVVTCRRVLSVRWHKGLWLLALEGIAARQEAELLRGWWLFLPALQQTERPPTFYYEHELVGSTCYSVDGQVLGQVAALVQGGAQMLLSVHTEGGNEVLVPFVSPLVVGVDLAAKRVILDPPQGLFAGHAL